MNLCALFLMMWMLIPLIKIKSLDTAAFKSLLGLNRVISFITGIIVIILTAKGVCFTKGNTDVLTGVALDSVISVYLLVGAPAVPLIASNIA